MSIKCLSDAGGYQSTSANLLGIWQLDGYAELPTGKKQRPELPRLAGAADLLNDLISSQKKVNRR